MPNSYGVSWEFTACFQSGSITPRILAELVEDFDLGFPPRRLSSDSFPKGLRFGPVALSKLKESVGFRYGRVAGPIIKPETGFYLEKLSVSEPDYGFQIICLMNREGASGPLVEKLIGLEGFISSYSTDWEDAFLQSMQDVNYFKQFKLPWQHLPMTKDLQGREVIDVSRNYGRQAVAGGMWLCAGASMWFGLPSFGVVDRDRLLSCPVGRVSVSGEVVRVDLFGLDDDLELIRERQRLFREWMDYDGIEQRFKDSPVENEGSGDPHIEFLSDDRVDGRPRRYVEWLRDGRPVRRSEANEMFEVVFGEFGESLSRGIRKVTDQDLA